ncbi:hypothetical protein D3C72_2556970 [compost metagenome]
MKSSALVAVAPAKSKVRPCCAARAVQFLMRLAFLSASETAAMFRVAHGSTMLFRKVSLSGEKFSPRSGTRTEVL